MIVFISFWMSEESCTICLHHLFVPRVNSDSIFPLLYVMSEILFTKYLLIFYVTEGIKDQLKKQFNVVVTSAGIGDKVRWIHVYFISSQPVEASLIISNLMQPLSFKPKNSRPQNVIIIIIIIYFTSYFSYFSLFDAYVQLKVLTTWCPWFSSLASV